MKKQNIRNTSLDTIKHHVIYFGHQTQKNSSDLFRGIFFNPKDWYGINALARCMELRRSRAWHRAKRVSKLVLLRIDAIHHFVMISYGTSCQFHTATSCGFHTRLRRDWVRAPTPIFSKPLQFPRFYAILITERRWGYEKINLCYSFHIGKRRTF